MGFDGNSFQTNGNPKEKNKKMYLFGSLAHHFDYLAVLSQLWLTSFKKCRTSRCRKIFVGPLNF